MMLVSLFLCNKFYIKTSCVAFVTEQKNKKW